MQDACSKTQKNPQTDCGLREENIFMEELRNRNPNLIEIGKVFETKEPEEVNRRVGEGWRVLMTGPDRDGRTRFSMGLPRVLKAEEIGDRTETTDPLKVFELLSTDNWRVLSVEELPDGSIRYSFGLPKAG